jgi:hypothetical protein
MADFIFHVGASASCPHQGQVSVVSTNMRVKVGGQYAATMGDTFTVGGCPFQIPTPGGPVPQPCIRVQWLVTAMRVRVSGQAVILKTSSGLCLSATQIPQGPPNIIQTQMRVKGT